MNKEIQFIADVHLGKLARLLRMAGLDTTYQNNYTITELASLAKEQGRVLLSRNELLTRQLSPLSLYINAENAAQQLADVLTQFEITNFQPFTRCIRCNGRLVPIDKNMVIDQLEPNTRQYFNEFWQCQNCKHIYWKGSHYDRMKKRMQALGIVDRV
jgi:uncharacterized protein